MNWRWISLSSIDWVKVILIMVILYRIMDTVEKGDGSLFLYLVFIIHLI